MDVKDLLQLKNALQIANRQVFIPSLLNN